MDLEQNYNAIDGVINNEKPKEKTPVLDKLQNAKLQYENVPKNLKLMRDKLISGWDCGMIY